VVDYVRNRRLRQPMPLFHFSWRLKKSRPRPTDIEPRPCAKTAGCQGLMTWHDRVPVGMTPDADEHIGAWVCDTCHRRIYDPEIPLSQH
jgi:hypothetical protein